ncbi:hypothetical protein AVEN_201152-1 [Araneus ventricosus]|uniref:Uncharacterized protein n=1 Tax=Araneus ventricosus TaxID=182803 RepID=A0A4Y2FIA3_ARAVE|nr:hypothetical protein AVEN_201152-1 [Araneus ventricosus]
MLVGRISPRWSSTGLTPFLGRPCQCGYFCTTPAGGRLAPTYDLSCNRPNTRRIFGGIGFRTWNTPALNPDLTTRPPRPPDPKGENLATDCKNLMTYV